MRIAINALSAKVGSALTFFDNFLPALAEVDDANDYFVIVAPWQAEVLPSVPRRFKRIVMPGVPRHFLARVLWEQLALPFRLRRLKIDVLYSTGNLVTLFPGCRSVMELTNASPFSTARIEWSRGEKLKQRFLRSMSMLAAHRADRVIFISEDSRDRIAARCGLSPEKTAVVYYGFTPFAAAAAGPPVRDADFVFTVSALLPHKNFETLMRGFDLLVGKHGYAGTLVIAGPPISAAYHEKLLRLRDELAHGEKIAITGRVSSEELASLYRHARLFVFPSVEETLGLPLQEAMGCGLPIAAADCRLASVPGEYFNPFREICGEAADYFDPYDPASICESMRRVIENDAYRQRLVSLGLERVRRFTWDRAARETLSIFRDLGPRS